MSYQDLPPRRERLSRLPAFAQYEDGKPPSQDPGTGSVWYPGSSEFPSSPRAAYPGGLGDTNPGNLGDAFAGGPGDAFAGGPGDAYRRSPRDAAHVPPWDDPPPQHTLSYPPMRQTGPFYADPDDPQEPTAGRGRGLLAGAIAGFLAAAVALGAANLTAAFVRPQASPIIAVGGAFIDRTPSWLKNFAVEKFGENDKTMLLLGMYVTIAVLAMVIGMIAWQHVSVGVVALALFGAFGAFVALTRPESRMTDVIPSAAGGVVGILAIIWLVHAGVSKSRFRTDRGDW
jgi:hypothetical protein